MRITTTLAAAAIGLSLAVAPAAAQQRIEMQIGHVLSADSAYHVAFTRFAELMASRTNNRVAVRVEHGGALGGELRLIQSVRTGVITGAFVGGSSLETVERDYRVLSLPYLFDDNAQAVRVLQGPTGQRLLGLLERHGMVGLGFGAVYERNIASRGRAINAVGDLRGLKIRVLQTPGFVEAYRVLGTQPTPMAYGELFLALQNGVVDALEISPDATVADRFVEVITNYALTKLHQSTTVFIMSKARFDALPRDIQATVREVARESILTSLAHHDRVNREGLAAIRARNIAVAEPNLAPFMAEARKSWDTILAEAPNGRALVAEIERAKRGGR